MPQGRYSLADLEDPVTRPPARSAGRSLAPPETVAPAPSGQGRFSLADLDDQEGLEPQADFRTTNARDAAGNPVVRGSFTGGEAMYGSGPGEDAQPRGEGDRIAGNIWDESTRTLRSIPSGLAHVLLNPHEIVTGPLAAHDVMRQKAVEAFQRGDYGATARHLGEYLVPIVTGVAGAAAGVPGGPPGMALGASAGYLGGTAAMSRASEAGDLAQQGEYSRAIGATVDAALQGALMKPTMNPRGAPVTARVIKPRTPANPAEVAAVQFGRELGVPIDAATATGSPYVRSLQKGASSTGMGARIAEPFRARQADALGRVGEDLAAQANPGRRAVDPIAAGENVQRALEGRIAARKADADRSYSRLRTLEAHAPEEVVPVRDGRSSVRDVAPEAIEQGFMLRWLADDLRELPFQKGGSTPAGRRAAYEAADATDDLGKRGFVSAPHVAGTPTQAMFHALGIKGSRAEIASRIDRVLQGQSKDARLTQLADVFREAWDGQRLDFELVSDATLSRAGVRRRELRSPQTLPDFSEPGASAFFPDEATNVPTRGGGDAVVEAQRLAVDLRPVKEALAPLYATLRREAEIGVPMMGSKGRSLSALDRLMNAPDHAPLSIADAALGDLKALSRTPDLAALRDRGQGIAAKAVQALEEQVQARAGQAGPDVLNALTTGREATRAKYETAAARRLIVGAKGSAEPRAIFNRLTANKDASIQKLRTLKRQAPEQVPSVSRALLEEILEGPTAEGAFDLAKGGKAYGDWQKIGPETKRILFVPEHVRALDHYFLLAKKLSENPNPSGTTTTSLAFKVTANLPGWAVAKVLYSPKAVRRLNTGLQMSFNSSKAAQAAAITQISSALHDAGVKLPAAAREELGLPAESDGAGGAGARKH